MGAYIGSALAKLGNSYLDQGEENRKIERQKQLDAQAEQERRGVAEDRRTTLQRLQEQMDFQQNEAQRKTRQMELERMQLDAALERSGVSDPVVRTGMLGDPATARSYLVREKPPAVKADDRYEEKPYMGGTARLKNGHFDSWIIRPASEKDNTVGQAMQAQKEFQRTTSLQGDFAGNPVVKQAQLYASAYQGIQAAAQENNPQSNLAMMYEAVKMRDPNAVREGELALQKSARSIPTWVRQAWNKAEKGNLLSMDERQQIVDWAGEKINQQGKLISPIQKRFGETARRFGVSGDSAYIAPNPFEGVTATSNPYKKLPRR